MIKFFILLAVIGTVITVFKFLISKQHSENYGSYSKKKILTDAEQAFYLELQKLVADRYYIFPQIHLASILAIDPRYRNWKTLFNKIIQKSVDFVLVGKENFEVRLVIELDDDTHLRKNRIIRDDFVDFSLNKAGIAIFRVKAHNKNELINKINHL